MEVLDRHPSTRPRQAAYTGVFRFEPQSPNSDNINLSKKWGFRQFFLRKKHQKAHKTEHFAPFLCGKRAVSRTSWVLFLKSVGTHALFAQINVVAIWAQRLESKYISLQTSAFPDRNLFCECLSQGQAPAAPASQAQHPLPLASTEAPHLASMFYRRRNIGIVEVAGRDATHPDNAYPLN